jgi:heme a synthase
MEWGHRVLGRIIGLSFVFPLAYFAFRRRLPIGMPAKLTGIALLIGAQGLLGWYMVKSGLEDSLMDTPHAVPRVSQYRLAAHLGTAVVLYAGMLYTGLGVIKDWRFAHGGKWSGAAAESVEAVLSNPAVKRFARYSKALTAFIFLTALSGKKFYLFCTIAMADLGNYCRCICRWSGRGSSLQRVSSDGWLHCPT